MDELRVAVLAARDKIVLFLSRFNRRRARPFAGSGGRRKRNPAGSHNPEIILVDGSPAIV
jgi:hypothetical protein